MELEQDSDTESSLLTTLGFEEVISEEGTNSPDVDETPSGDTFRTYAELEDDADLVVEYIADDMDVCNINDYLDEAITSNLEQFQYNWETECPICVEAFATFQDLLQHCKSYHKNEFDEFNCVFTDCGAILADERQLERHLILAHSDLHSLPIYCNCPYCDRRFSTFPQLNKHSCFNKLTRRAGRNNYCHICKDDFTSFKRFVFHLQFHLTMRRPKACLICSKQFVDVDELCAHVNYSHEPPDAMYCISCDRVFQERHAFEAHQLSHKKTHKKYSCTTCFKTYHEKHSLIEHWEASHRSDNDDACTVCGKVFVTLSHLQRHMKSHQPEAEVEAYVCGSCGVIARDRETLLRDHTSIEESYCFDATIEKEFLVSAYTCWHCELDYKEKDDLRSHRDSGVHANGKYICPLCSIEGDSYRFLRLHVKSHQNYKSWLSSFPLKRLHLCDADGCDESFAKWSAFQRHKSRHHKPNTCAVCSLSLPNEAEYESHIANCKEAPKYICQFCEKECPSKMSLAVHIAKSHNNKNSICPTCNTSHKGEAALQEHIDNVHVPIACELCHRIVKNRRYMEVHMRSVHKSGHRFFCKVCNKGFLHRCQKDLHERRVHTDAVHKCSECNFSTSYPKSLALHMQKHNNSYQLQCTLCCRKFNRKQALELHMKRHLGDKQFVCRERIVGGCDAAFISHYLLNQHIKVKHSQLQHTKKRPSRSKVKATVTKLPVRLGNRATAPRRLEQQPAVDAVTNAGMYFDADVDVEVNVDDDFTPALMSNDLFDSCANDELLNLDGMCAETNDDECMLLVVDDATMSLLVDNNGENVNVDDLQQMQLPEIDEFNAE